METSLPLREVRKRLFALPSPWRDLVLPYALEAAQAGAAIDAQSGAMLLGPQPDLGPLSYAICLFPPASESELRRYEDHLEVDLPHMAKLYLQAFNGAHFFQFQLWGADSFYAREPWPASRAPRYCADIGTELLIRRRRSATAIVTIGERNASLNDVHRYEPSGLGVSAYDRQGKHVGNWSNYEEWLNRELASAAAFAPEWRRAMASLLRGDDA
jgi:hypothetical protein